MIIALLPSPGAPSLFPVPSPCNFCPGSPCLFFICPQPISPNFGPVSGTFLLHLQDLQRCTCSRPPGHLQASSPLICIMYPPLLYAGLFFFCFNSKVYYCWSNYAFEKDHRLQVKGKTGSCNGQGGKQKGGEREKKTKLSIKNNRQVSKGREKEEFEADRK